MVGERGKWSGGRRVAFSESQPERNAPPPGHRRKADAAAFLPMQARDERAVCEAERASSRGDGATGSPWSEANRALVTAIEQSRNAASTRLVGESFASLQNNCAGA